ncbi:DUF2589 domain-containing protein [Lewinella sp. IMCC34183]|uniref:DUF2589 domain-containing protein n=1 Tax=Lewinella sp. IMCC34183 TaxID=2248762 RepID=UPI000E265E53|nr:DUF2589 domain-containing protein [Lewinella sp. IMCC34183]
MLTLHSFLQEDHSRKKKAEIVDLLTNLHELIGADAYASVSGIDPDGELPELNKADMLKVVQDFRDAYSPEWEARLANASNEVLTGIFGLVAAEDRQFSAAENAAFDAKFADELGSIDFSTLISGPLNAAVEAQNKASVATVNFIKEVGFDRDATGAVTGLKMANFSYTKTVPDDNGGTETENVEVKVPFISILNVPCLRVETLDIDLNVKLNSTATKDVSSSLGVNAGASGGWGPVKMKVSAAYRRSSATGVKVEKEYSMNVKVKATNDELPGGLEKVLGLLIA